MATAAVLTVDESGLEVRGQLALNVPPGTTAAARDTLLNQALGAELGEIARSLQVVLAAAPSAFARALRGKRADGMTLFEVGGRIEGDRLIPAARSGARK